MRAYKPHEGYEYYEDYEYCFIGFAVKQTVACNIPATSPTRLVSQKVLRFSRKVMGGVGGSENHLFS